MGNSTIVADASVLINFLRIDRMDLIRDHPSTFITTEHVAGEIRVRDRDSRYVVALRDNILEEVEVVGSDELRLHAKLAGERDLGIGERSAAAVALCHGYGLAIDDKAAIERLKQWAQLAGSSLTIVRTENIIVELIKRKIIRMSEADEILRVWRSDHKFALKISSFKELL